MRLLHAITTLGTGGAEKLLVDSIPLYRQKGIEVELLLLNGMRTPFYDMLEKQGVRIYSLSNGSVKTVYNPFHIIKIIPFLKKYDIIHVHLFPTLYWFAIARILTKCDSKFIFTEHNTSNKRVGSKIGYYIDNIIYRQYEKIVSIMDGVDDVIKKHLNKIPPSHFSIIHNGINLSHFLQIKGRSNQSEGLFALIQVSSFRKQKDQETLINALQYLPDSVKLKLVGDGELRSQCENLVNSLGLSNRVEFLGIRTDIPELLNQADIVILSSHYEGLSLSSIEGMASGRPFIASDVPGLRDVVKGAGLLFPKGDAKALAHLVSQLISDHDLYAKVAKACRERALEFDINIMVDKYIDLYKEVLSNHA